MSLHIRKAERFYQEKDEDDYNYDLLASVL